MSKRRFLPTLLGGSALGAGAAVTALWPYPLSLQGAGATLAGGAAFGLVVAATVTLTRTLPRVAFFGVCALAGAAGGAVWWLVIHPPTGLPLAVAIGCVVALGVTLFEEFFGQAAA
jgi:hypothetical protein